MNKNHGASLSQLSKGSAIQIRTQFAHAFSDIRYRKIETKYCVFFVHQKNMYTLDYSVKKNAISRFANIQIYLNIQHQNTKRKTISA